MMLLVLVQVVAGGQDDPDSQQRAQVPSLVQVWPESQSISCQLDPLYHPMRPGSSEIVDESRGKTRALLRSGAGVTRGMAGMRLCSIALAAATEASARDKSIGCIGEGAGLFSRLVLLFLF